MDFLTEVLPIIDGSTSIITCLLFLQLHNIKQDIDEIKQQNNSLDKRLNKLEIQAARRWSTWRQE